ncbi:MAG: FAD-binding oxidoreductase, partial [Stackebrandtia sp.]
MDHTRLTVRLREILPDDAVITDPAQRYTYACDGLTSHSAIPAIVVLPTSAEQIAAVVKACVAANVPYVARGSGTGLSGGALPHVDGVLVVTSRMRTILEIDLANRVAVVEPGVINLAVTRAVAADGYYYAPDPSSQQVCSIGGNVAENSGGAHCLKYGFTVNHVLGLEIVTPDGEIVTLGGPVADPVGYDLTGVFVGSEGTLGIATKVTVRLSVSPAEVVTVLAAFDGVDAAAECVSAIIAAGVIPAAIEMMDATAIEAAEAAVACHYPAGAGAVLIVEVDGPAQEVAAEFAAVRE